MGMYTEMNFNFNLKKDTPSDVVKRLGYMIYGKNVFYDDINEDHELFYTTRWKVMLRCGSYYFDGNYSGSIEVDDATDDIKVSFRSSFKNYNNELALFLGWIGKYISTEGFIGYFMYEEDSKPTLMFNDHGKIYGTL